MNGVSDKSVIRPENITHDKNIGPALSEAKRLKSERGPAK